MQSNTINTNKTSLVCKVKKVVFHNQSNGYSVLSVFSDTEDVPFSICGILNGKPEGTVLHCQGEWKNHIMYGRQLIVDSWEEGKADEVKKLYGIQSRANSSLVYRTWGDFLKYNPDAAEKVKYVTEVFFTDVEKDFDDAVYSSYGCCDIPFTAQAKAIYYAVYGDQKISLIVCTFTVHGSCTEYLDDDDANEIEEMEGCVDIPAIVRKYSCFAGIEDVEGLSNLDFRASGVPVCEDELKKMYYEDDKDEKVDSDEIEDYNELLDYSIDEMKTDIESALETAFFNAFIELEDGEYQCSRMFSRSKLSGEFSGI